MIVLCVLLHLQSESLLCVRPCLHAAAMLHAAAIPRRGLDGPSPEETAVISAVHQCSTQFLLVHGTGKQCASKSALWANTPARPAACPQLSESSVSSLILGRGPPRSPW